MLDVGGLQEGSLRLTAGIVKIHEKASAPKVSFTKNWVGSCIVFLYEGDSAKTRRTHCPKGMSIVSNTVLSFDDPKIQSEIYGAVKQRCRGNHGETGARYVQMKQEDFLNIKKQVDVLSTCFL